MQRYTGKHAIYFVPQTFANEDAPPFSAIFWNVENTEDLKRRITNHLISDYGLILDQIIPLFADDELAVTIFPDFLTEKLLEQIAGLDEPADICRTFDEITECLNKINR